MSRIAHQVLVLAPGPCLSNFFEAAATGVEKCTKWFWKKSGEGYWKDKFKFRTHDSLMVKLGQATTFALHFRC